MPSWSGAGVRNHPTGASCLTSSGEMPMSQVSPSLGLEVRGRGDTKHHSLASLLRLQQPGGGTSTPIFWPPGLLGSGESAAGLQDSAQLHSQPQQHLTAPSILFKPVAYVPPASGPFHPLFFLLGMPFFSE